MRRKPLQPNIILLMADQWRWDCFGFAGHPDVQTPNLDMLASHALCFSQAMASSLDTATARRDCLFMAGDGESHALAAVLVKAGYSTAAVGALAGPGTDPGHGFQQIQCADSVAAVGGQGAYAAWLEKAGKKDRIAAQADRPLIEAPVAYRKSFGALRSNLPEPYCATSWIGDQALSLLRQLTDPFFLCVSFSKPAPPFDPPSPWDTLYDRDALQLPPEFPRIAEAVARDWGWPLTEARFRKVLAYYYANISLVDKQIGRLLATLNARGITRNILVFLSPHGLILESEANFWERHIRVPLLIAGAPGQRRGEVDTSPVQLQDLPATLSDLAGVAPPLKHRPLPLLREAISSPRPCARLKLPDGRSVLRTPAHKLIASSMPETGALYDLRADPQEEENRYHSPAFRKLRNTLLEQLEAEKPPDLSPPVELG